MNVTIVEREEPRPSGGGSSGSSYSISVDSGSHGSLTVSPRNASKGDKVTITVNPDDGYVLKDLTATASNGDEIELTKRADGRYTFTMPAGSVKVKTTWAIGTETVAGFRDVPSDAYYADAVAWAAEEEITGGITATTFGPNNGCTRGQVVTFPVESGWFSCGEYGQSLYRRFRRCLQLSGNPVGICQRHYPAA